MNRQEVAAEVNRAIVRLLLTDSENEQALLENARALAEALEIGGVERDPLAMRRIGNTVSALLVYSE